MTNYKKPADIIPSNDKARVTKLHGYEILDTPAETGFDAIAMLAAAIFETENAFISFVDQDQVFFKASISSLPACKIQRADSLCALTILENDITIFKDTLQIAEFKDSPFLYNFGTGQTRFYAAASLKTADGFAIGAIGVTDTQPHLQTSERQMNMLKTLSYIVMEKLEAHLNTREAVKANEAILHRLVHDLKSPLTSISLYSQLLEAKEITPEKVIGMAGKIQKSIKNIEAQLNQLFLRRADKNAEH